MPVIAVIDGGERRRCWLRVGSGVVLEARHGLPPVLPIRLIFLLIVAVGVCLGPATSVHADTNSQIDRFSLWTECQGMNLLVSSDGKALPTKESIATAVRSRLRAARMYDDRQLGFHVNFLIHVAVAAIGSAFHVSIQFQKGLRDSWSGEENLATTWQRDVVGTHDNNPEYLRSAVFGLTDEFIDEYLRVNVDACRYRQRELAPLRPLLSR